MLESKYLNRFKKLRECGTGEYTLIGNRLLVEVLPKEELKSAGGLVIATTLNQKSDTTANQATLAIVLLVGEGYYDEDGNDAPMPFEVGNIVLVSDMGLKKYTSFPGMAAYTENSIALTRDSEVHLKFPSVEAYEKVKELLNG
jgi:co-chaperonin GroES (HSP10)